MLALMRMLAGWKRQLLLFVVAAVALYLVAESLKATSKVKQDKKH